MTQVALREVVDVTGGGTPRKSVTDYYGGGIPWVTPKDMKRLLIGESEVTLSDDGVRSSPAKLVPEGSVLVVVRSGVLKHTLPVALTTRAVTVNQDMKALTPRGGLDPSYLARMLKALQPTVLTWVRATTADNFPIDRLLDLEFDLPPLPEQRRIAAILDHADALRAKRRQVLSHLDALTQSIFHDMFAGFGWTTEFGTLIASGPTNGMYRPASDYGDGAPILRIDGFSSGAVLAGNSGWKRLRANPSEIQRFALTAGDLVVNRVNALSHLGKSALISQVDEPSVYESNMMRIRIDPNRTNSAFVLGWLQTARTKQQILRKAKKAINQASINQTDVKSLLIPLPPLALQRQFATKVETVNNQRAMIERSASADNELFTSLQVRAFRGEL